jgi:transcription-repair coupling factor (superfamily II helicase)
LLDEAVHELKRDEFAELFPEDAGFTGGRQVVVEAEIEALIPQEYIPGEGERLAIYRRLHGLTGTDQLEEIGNELRDRFGRIPHQVEGLFGVIRLKLLAAQLGFAKLHLDTERLEVHFPPQEDAAYYASPLFQDLMTVISRKRERGVRLSQTDALLKVIVPLNAGTDSAAAIARSMEFLTELTAVLPASATASAVV